jgi:hypothetical protein
MNRNAALRFRLAFGLTVVGMAGLLVSAVVVLRWSTIAAGRPIIVAQPTSLGIPNVKSAVPKTKAQPSISMAEQLDLARSLDSDDPAIRQTAVQQIRALAFSDRKSFAVGLPQWVSPLLNAKQYSDLDQFAVKAITERSFDPATVQAAQRGHVMALIAEGKFPSALQEAKRYYNVASLSATADAVSLIAQILRQTADSSSANRFKAEQTQPGVHSPVLASIEVDSKSYLHTIELQKKRETGRDAHSFTVLMALGNLTLLTDSPVEAKEYFERACKAATRGGRNLRLAVEGVAEAIRATNGNADAADAFITSLRANPELMGAELTNAGLPPMEELRVAAQHIALANLSKALLPSLEQERARQESTADGSLAPPQVVTGFEGSTPVYATAVSPTHLVVEITTAGFRDWFMFQVKGVAGRTVRIDITGAYKTVPNWSQKAWSLDPVYSYCSDINQPDLTQPNSTAAGQAVAFNGPVLPDTTGQAWHYVSQTWTDDYTLSCVMHFDADSAYIAMRVPRTTTYNERFVRGLVASQYAKVVQVGKSARGRPLLVAEIGTPRAGKPCVLVYAGEHADEQDAGWVAQGVIDYLLGDSAEAAQIRDHFTFLVIPTLDPDASAAGIHQSIISSFLPGRTTPESIQYSNWFQNWINSGNRLDLSIDLHNVQSAEGPHIFCPILESLGRRGAQSLSLYRLTNKNMQLAGYGIRSNLPMRGWAPDRLCGWLSHYYGSLSIPYEVNSQAPERHLSLAEIKGIGGILAKSVGQFFARDEGVSALADGDAFRHERSERWARSTLSSAATNAIDSEANVLRSAVNGAETTASSDRFIP